MAHHKAKCFLLVPSKEFALPLKTALGKKGISIHTQFDQESDAQFSLNSFDAVIAFFENPQGDNPGHPTHRAVYFSNRNGSADLIEAQKDGLYDFSKIQAVNLNAERIISHLDRVLLNTAKASKNRTTKGENALAQIIGRSAAIKHVKEMIQRVSQFPDVTVLITGETGTGKELVANALHACSHRSDKPLIRINCSAIPENLFESQLFGHRRGAFSGAVVQQKGLVEEAADGTLFLDEIGSLKLELQPKLLRFLEDGSYLPVGEMRERKSNAWVIAATNNRLEELVNQGFFREDLYFRLKALQISIPPLRERQEDITVLAQYYLHKIAKSSDWQAARTLSHQALEKFTHYSWPGNVRELKQLVIALHAFTTGLTILPDHLPPQLRNSKNEARQRRSKVLSLEELQRRYIAKILQRNNFNVKKTAKLLGIDRNTLSRKIERYEIKSAAFCSTD